MAPLIKDTLEIATSSTPAESSQPSHDRISAAPLRAGAVSLEVRLKVHGSKVTEIGRGLPPRTEPFEEQTSTMIVFPQGGVLRLAAPVATGQMLVLTNLKSGKDAICRVVKVRSNGSLQGYVEVEFTARQPGYWGVNFPGDPAPSSRPAAATVAPASSPAPTAAPASGPTSSPQPPKPSAPASAFTSIGSQEKTQPAATAISRPPSSPAPPAVSKPPVSTAAPEPLLDEAKLTAAIASISQPEPKSASISLSLDDLIGDAIASAKSDSVAATLANATMGHGPAAQADRTDESSLVSHEEESAGFASSVGDPLVAVEDSVFHAEASPAKRNWFLFAACVAFAFVAAAGGFFFLHSRAARHSVATVAAAPRAAAGSPLDAPSDSSAMGVPISRESVDAPVLPAPQSAAPLGPAFAGNTSAPASTSFARASVTPPAPKPAVTTEMVTETLNSHPVAAEHVSDATAEAPSVVPAAGENNSAALPGAIAAPSSISIPTPSLQPSGPVKVGGQVKEPRLISSLPPAYPHEALTFNVQGDVVIQGTIDKKGVVSDAHVVSGPALLRQSALDAFRRWKYEPSTLDGQPIVAKIVVTIHFHRQ